MIRPIKHFYVEMCVKFWVLLLAVFGTFAAAQNRVQPSPQQHKRVDQELTLTLSLDQTDERSDSGMLQSCLVHHPPIACQLLSIKVQNDGTHTVLIWQSTCALFGHFRFDFQNVDGKWEAFPRDDRMAICTRSYTEAKKLSPGQSYTEHSRLADYTLHKDNSYPPFNDALRHPGYEFLLADEHGIRARWHEGACVASDKLKEDFVPDGFTVVSYCAPDTQLQNGVDLVSNELKFPVGL